MSQIMPFSSDEQVQKSYDLLNSMDKPACPGCQRGVRMCKHTPCIGTVEDMEKLIDAGYAKKLMLDWWVGESSKYKSLKSSIGVDSPTKLSKNEERNPFTEDISYLVPAIVGKEGQKAPFAKTGICTMLVNDLCSLHDQGLKPTQGSFACCKIDRVYIDEKGKEQDFDERLIILRTWNTQKGKDLIERWKAEVNYKGNNDGAEIPMTLPDMMEAMLSILGSIKMYDEEFPEDLRPVVKQIYENPN